MFCSGIVSLSGGQRAISTSTYALRLGWIATNFLAFLNGTPHPFTVATEQGLPSVINSLRQIWLLRDTSK